MIRALADGVHPVTGELLPAESPIQSPDIICALYAAAKALEAQARTARKAAQPKNAGEPWTEKEDSALRQKFDRGQAVAEIAQAHGRTPGAITARLVKLQLIAPESRD